MNYLTNSSIIPQNYEGIIHVMTVKAECVKELLEKEGFQSAIGHESTARVLSQILGIEINMNRIQIEAEVGDAIISFQLAERLPEGKILSEEELESLEYQFREIWFMK